MVPLVDISMSAPSAFFVHLAGQHLLGRGVVLALEAIMLVSLGWVFLVLIGYPAALHLIPPRRKRRPVADPPEVDRPTVSMLIVVRNGEDLIEPKLQNSFELEYPSDRLEIVVYSDGSTDRTVEVARRHADRGVKVFESGEHIGKNEALNRAGSPHRLRPAHALPAGAGHGARGVALVPPPVLLTGDLVARRSRWRKYSHTMT